MKLDYSVTYVHEGSVVVPDNLTPSERLEAIEAAVAGTAPTWSAPVYWIDTEEDGE